jgi:pimeloyl-ACP methyl ester carboxylesterase
MRLAVSLFLILAALVAGLVVAVDRRADRREAEAEVAFPPIGQMITVNGRQIHAWVQGSGPDLVLIHGAGGNLRDFTMAFTAKLSGRYRVIAFDRPGAGYSERAQDTLMGAFLNRAESPAEQAELLHAAARALGAERPIVLGHSYGASVAMAWALAYPDDIAGIVNVSGATMPWPGRLDRFYTVMGSRLGGAIVPPLIAAFAGGRQVDSTLVSVFAPDAVPAGYAEGIGAGLSMRRDALRANARQVNSLLGHVTAMSRDYGTIVVPMEIVHGDADLSVPLDIHSRPLSGLVPDARLTVLPGVGHMPHHTDPDAVIAAIDRVATRAGLRWGQALPILR